MRFAFATFFVLFLCASAIAETQVQGDLYSALLKQAPQINPKVLQLALNATSCAEQQGIGNGNTLTVIDFSLPSSQKRLWTFDLRTRHLLFHEWVAHGKTTGENRALHFSNDMESVSSSLGLYRTDVPYIGRNGYSLRLVGLEKGYNDNVYPRAVVFHGAWYVSEQMIKTWGRLGRSYGCPAVRKEISTAMIDVIKNGSYMFAYYPDQDWMKQSRFLSTCTAPKPQLMASDSVQAVSAKSPRK